MMENLLSISTLFYLLFVYLEKKKKKKKLDLSTYCVYACMWRNKISSVYLTRQEADMFPSTGIRWYRVKFSIYLGKRCIRRSITKANTNICTHLEQFLLSVSSICHLSRQYQYICIYNDKVIRLPISIIFELNGYFLFFPSSF